MGSCSVAVSQVGGAFHVALGVCVCVLNYGPVFFFYSFIIHKFFFFSSVVAKPRKKKSDKKNRENSAAACADYCPFESIVRWLHGGDFLATLGSCVVVALKALRSESELKKKEEKKNVCRNGATRSGRGEAAA